MSAQCCWFSNLSAKHKGEKLLWLKEPGGGKVKGKYQK